MFINLLLNSPAFAIVWIVVIFMSLTVHEFSHALAANKLGDKTAEYMGRLTLNPLKHIDPVGLIPLLLFGFGWAKPVPFNPYNLQDPKRDAVIIALAGPFSNLVIAILAGIVIQVMSATVGLDFSNLLVIFLFLLIFINLILLFFNVIPVHPLDGSKLLDALLSKPEHQQLRQTIALWGPRVLMGLIILSIATPFEPFAFLYGPTAYVCDLLTSGACSSLF